jgi:predicted nucleic acid-binding protein
MVTTIEPGEAVFLDTSYALALSAPTDQFHIRALQLAELETTKARLITTRAVLLEIGNALARRRYRAAAITLLKMLESDPTAEIEPLTNDLYGRGLGLFCSRPDKEWGLIDCVSFTVMKDRQMTKALTADEHFAQAGFQVLLREPTT